MVEQVGVILNYCLLLFSIVAVMEKNSQLIQAHL